MALVTVSTFLMMILWVLKMVYTRKVYLTRSVIDLGLVFFLFSVILSTFFSIHKVSSIFGSYGRWFPSLFGFIVLICYYYVTVSNLEGVRTAKRILLSFVAGSTVSTLVALLSYFGIRLGSAPYFQTLNFTLTGSSTTAAFLAALSLLIALAYLMYAKTLPGKLVLAQIIIVNMLGVALLAGISVYVALAVGAFGLLWLVSMDQIRENKVVLMGIAGVAAALTLIMVVPTTRNLVLNKNYPRELMLPALHSRIVSFSVLRDYPVFGSGLSTFYLNFPVYRSAVLNRTDFWNIRFDKPNSEVFNVIAGMGMLGIAAVLFLTTKSLRLVVLPRSLKEESGTLLIVSVGILTTVAFLALSFATVLSGFILFMLLALGVGIAASLGEKRISDKINLSLSSLSGNNNSMSILGDLNEKSEILPYIIALPMIGLIIYGSYIFYRTYAAEYYIRRSLEASIRNDGGATYDLQAKAIQLNPNRDVYHSAYAQTSILIANSLAGKQDLTDTDKQTIQNLIAQAIRNARVATEVVNPLNVNNWEVRALIYRSLTGAAQDADQWALSAYNNAVKLDPTNPRLLVDLGGVFYAKQDYLNAASMFRQATALKPDYANAHYNFAHALSNLKSYADAQKEFELVQALVPQESEDYKRVSEDIVKMKELAGQAAESKPTVEQLETSNQSGRNTEPTVQEPLERPGETPRVNEQQVIPTPSVAPTQQPTPTPSPTPIPAGNN